jgi:predicted transport protein
LDTILVDAPRSLLKTVREATVDQSISPQQIKESLARIWRKLAGGIALDAEASPDLARLLIDTGAGAKRTTSPRRATRSESPYDEPHHTAGKPKEAIELYRAVDRLCFSLASEGVTKRYLAKYISYGRGKRGFCSVHLQQGGLRVWLKLKYSRLSAPPKFARDVSGVGHWGTGDLELGITSLAQLEEAEPLIRQSFDAAG